MIYRRRLEADLDELRPEIDILTNATRQLRSCRRFPKLLQVFSF